MRVDESAHTILVVEDEVLVRFDISEALRTRGHNVLEAANADEAIKILKSGVFVSLVFTDVRMPGALDGVGLAKHIWANYPAIPCILTSAHFSLSELPDPKLGPLIPKPYGTKRVADEIERHLPARPKNVGSQTK